MHTCMQGEHDSPEFKRQAREYHAAVCARVGASRCSWREVAGEDHFTVIERLEEPDYVLTKGISRLIEEGY